MRTWICALVVACQLGCRDDQPRAHIDDFGPGPDVICRADNVSASCEPCNPLLQTGCNTAERCTWFHADGSTPPIGIVGCAPIGPVMVGDACTFGEPGATGFDDCMLGAVCVDGTCRAICDHQGGTPTCPTELQCARERGLFGAVGSTSPPIAGVCTPVCDPFADNDPLGSGSKPGLQCTATEGCYGLPHTSGVPTTWQCETPLEPHVHGGAPGEVDIASCAPGYEPFLAGATGSLAFTCLAICTPGNAYLGNPGANQPNGIAPHACNTTDARGTFGPIATDATNGEHCMYSWRFEVDVLGQLHRSPTSDTVGFCVDHTTFRYDSNADEVIDSSDGTMPACSSLPLVNSTGGLTAADFGCVDSTTANAMSKLRKLPLIRAR
ncbi:MAG: hypothetical protein H0T79_12500 [Deltaproteobacteria bacterium]|nr:hypothetical protein [Deltaproteobacteria bacterium]